MQASICEECRRETKTLSHLVWYCSCAKEVWESSKLVFPSGLNQRQLSFKDILWKLFTSDDKKWTDMAARFIAGAWAIWFNQNGRRHGGKREEGKELMD